MLSKRRSGELPSSTAAEVLDGVVEAWTMADPRIRVRLGATMAASVILARGRMPAIPAVLAAVGVGVLAERAYVIVHDVHQAAIAVAAGVGPFTDPLDPASPARDLPGWSGELRRPGSKRAAKRDKGRDQAENGKRCSVVRCRACLQHQGQGTPVNHRHIVRP